MQFSTVMEGCQRKWRAIVSSDLLTPNGGMWYNWGGGIFQMHDWVHQR